MVPLPTPRRNSRSLSRAFSGFLLAIAVFGRPGAANAQLYVGQNTEKVGEYNPTSGAAINASFISTGSSNPQGLALFGNSLFVVTDTHVGQYNATTGAAINTNFIAGLSGAWSLTLAGSNLFVSNGNTVGEYSAITGAAINASLITAGLSQPDGLAIFGNILFVSNYGNGTVGEFNAVTGAVIKYGFISGLGGPQGLAVSGNTLYVANYDRYSIGEYDATTGTAINASLITAGVVGPQGLALSGNNLYVSNFDNNAVGEFNATTGAAINANFITGLSGPEGIIVLPESSSSTMIAMAVSAALLCRWRRKRSLQVF